MSAARARVFVTLLGLVAPSSLPAQTADPLFAGVRWAPQPPGSRPAGIGGAFAAVADGGKASYFNPAGLAQVPLKELELSFADPWVSGGVKLGALRFGAYATRNSHEPAPGTLDWTFSELGIGVGVAPLDRLKLGVSAAWSGLELAGRRTALGASGQETLLAEVSGEDRRLRVTAGALWTIYAREVHGLPSVRLGLAYQRGFDWRAQLSEPGPGGTLSRSIDVRRPSVLTAALSYYGTSQWSFFAQGDVIRYGEVLGAVRRNGGSGARDFEIGDAIEPRLGTELAIPLTCGCGTVKLRGGLQYLSPGTLVYTGADPVLEQLFGARSWRTVASLGASFFAEYFGRALRFDLDSKDLLEGPALSLGVVLRF
jgi:hypothetical protein